MNCHQGIRIAAARLDLHEHGRICHIGRQVDPGHRLDQAARAIDLGHDLADRLGQVLRRLDLRLIGELDELFVIAGDDARGIEMHDDVGIRDRVLQRRIRRRSLWIGL